TPDRPKTFELAPIVETAPSPPKDDPFDDRRALILAKADVLLKLDRTDDAIAQFTDLLAKTPDDVELLEKRRGARSQAKDYFTAAADASSIIRLRPDWWRGYYLRGEVWFEKKDWEKSLPDYSKAIELDPANFSPGWPRGDASQKAANETQPIPDREKDMELNPPTSKFPNTRAWVLPTPSDDSPAGGRPALVHATKACELAK